jgi:hypothetical protein
MRDAFWVLILILLTVAVASIVALIFVQKQGRYGSRITRFDDRIYEEDQLLAEDIISEEQLMSRQVTDKTDWAAVTEVTPSSRAILTRSAIQIGERTLPDVIINEADECVFDADCAGDTFCRRSGVYYANEEAADMDCPALDGKSVIRMVFDAADKAQLNVEDVGEIQWLNTDWIVLTTNTRTVFLTSKQQTRNVTSNVPLSDIYVGKNKIYGISSEKLYSLPLKCAMRDHVWTMQEVKHAPNNVKALEGTHNGEVITLLTDSGTYFLKGERVVRHLKRTVPIVMGNTENDYLLFTESGIDVLPNKIHIDEARAGVITTDSRLFTMDPSKNQWAKRFRNIGSEPVLISRAVCVPRNAPDIKLIL